MLRFILAYQVSAIAQVQSTVFTSNKAAHSRPPFLWFFTTSEFTIFSVDRVGTLSLPFQTTGKLEGCAPAASFSTHCRHQSAMLVHCCHRVHPVLPHFNNTPLVIEKNIKVLLNHILFRTKVTAQPKARLTTENVRVQFPAPMVASPTTN